jgi:hypothetical protein
VGRYFELAAEEAHPIPAGTAGGVLTFFYHLIFVVTLGLPSALLIKWLQGLMAVCLVISGLLLACVRLTYKRSNEAAAAVAKVAGSTRIH